jgi:ketosteroid isomerase-like protein
MSTPSELAVKQYFSAIRAKDIERLMETFDAEAQLHDPVGTLPHHGKTKIRVFFSHVFKNFREVTLTEESVYACGNFIAVKWNGTATGPGGASCVFSGIDTFETTEAGQIKLILAFWNIDPVMALLQV